MAAEAKALVAAKKREKEDTARREREAEMKARASPRGGGATQAPRPGLTQDEFAGALADAGASAGLQADVMVFRAFAREAGGERTLEPAIFLEAVDMAEPEGRE